MRRVKEGAMLLCMLVLVSQAQAQQFNSDSWLSKPHGTVTIIPTIGQRNSMLMTTFSLFPRWEFTVAAYLYNDDGDIRTADGYSSSLYAKYMFYQNKKETGGASVKFGTGMKPGTIDGPDRTLDAFRSVWINFPCTIPFLDNKLPLDLMPGASVRSNFGQSSEVASGFTYSARLAWYPFHPEWSGVAEVFGTEGGIQSNPEYKAGVRWEPSKYAVFALTYGQEFQTSQGAKFEFGIMLFSPPFVCFKGCK